MAARPLRVCVIREKRNCDEWTAEAIKQNPWLMDAARSTGGDYAEKVRFSLAGRSSSAAAIAN